MPIADDGPESKSARTHTRILDAAASILSRKGHASTQLSEVAELAELQAPAIYYYFPDQLDLRTARMPTLTALIWASKWWTSEAGPLDTVVRTAQIMVRGGLRGETATQPLDV